ncbi:MAG: LuxR family transcriptional regulator [Alphaproteobacteria bacterium]|nr:LuxR family transcriptional regulator [Alphaproteobacteria bacterium]
MILRSAVTALLVLCAAVPALAQSGNQTGKKPVITASTPTPDDRARQWLVLVDDKNYSSSWMQSGKAFQGRQKADAWARDAGVRREPLGAVASRGLKSIDLSRSNVAVIRYDTVFAHKAAAVETVTLSFENGSWAVTDYSVT